jgi:universal stress protein A
MRPIRRILCPVDFSALSDRELELAARLAARFEAELLLQHNLASGSALGVSWMHEQEHHEGAAKREKDARAKLSALMSSLPPAVRAKARGALTYGGLHHCVDNLATQADVDLIVIGTHGRAAADHRSETERLITNAPCPVLTTRDDAPHLGLPTLDAGDAARLPTLVPVDFSKHSLTALRYALQLRDPLALEITVLYVPDREEHGPGWAEARLSEALPQDSRALFQLEIKTGKPVEQIIDEEIALHARLVVMGSHAPGLIERVLTSDLPTSREVLHRSACPVWFVPASART